MEENSWITEALVQFSESPLWKTPVENFIDDNCCIFSVDSEMKLEYTVVHNKFRELVDSLLTSCVVELGVPMETAVEALRATLHEHGSDSDTRTQRRAAKKMLMQVFNADNFSSFYTMMVKRNLELDILASASLTARGVNLGDGAMTTSAELQDESEVMPARAQRAIDANGDVGEDEALRRALAASLQDPNSQEQMRAYSEVCAQESVNLQVEDAERDAQQQKIQLEEALRGRARTPEVEQFRKERLQLIEEQKNSQIVQIQNHTLTGANQSSYNDNRCLTAEFSSPAIPEAVPPPAPSPNRAKNAAPTVAPVASVPAQPPAPTVPPPSTALPPIGHQQGALPSIARKAAAASPTGSAGSVAPSTTAPAAMNAAAPPAAATGPNKKELDRRAQYMRDQREMILARNRASRQQQLNSYVQHTQPSADASSGAAAATGAQKNVTVEIARRLRGDLVGEGRKSAN
ncbi:hypothetical protein ABB37_05065 [Leptomonas pyrrhocoris]|uniref:Cilia- and flagella-associated protein 36 n=1 Tax=Leptomonas pyrrhocoris TaxID=157538 RepID=A0A0M9G0R5_LEPPY|nr:hypothetical protein ABB37_05065 [Leptomonas pyrrhocoris]XP_015658489.1 hypothetical protein ABB37_05065 [Leptomonas pyrrhocoris]KPA80049.1 hypothetical protein ABB37_05065 [Leptomonas pyrrhocoris]KPA80050.1 hypothetical protein ABB37_05065 [Leptomonas pyrrhocoris]|eukprot:XP_015658488.1 hypothetical protein ABB37_05065 [Leptomonas pyrrhocoris]